MLLRGDDRGSAPARRCEIAMRTSTGLYQTHARDYDHELITPSPHGNWQLLYTPQDPSVNLLTLHQRSFNLLLTFVELGGYDPARLTLARATREFPQLGEQ